MSKIPLERFLSLVEQSGLIERDRLAQVLSEWRSQAPPGRWDDAYTCGEHLVAAGLITAWQCQKLLDGRHRGFRLGNYKLLDHLGSGGMSNVYLAEHVLMQRRVAIKVLPHNRVADSSQLARFHFEGQAVAALDHRNIVRAYDLGHEGRIHYLVMEYIEGSNLEDLVKQAGPLNPVTAAGYIVQAAAGLEHAHGCGMVHRDVKPANLLVDRHETVRILDMGLAKFKAEVRPVPAFARDEQVLGTADYLAPEQAANSLSVDHRADIYSLGCTLYFLLRGHPPFSGRTAGELVAAHQQQPPPNLLDERPEIPAGLAMICQKMMQKSPDERYQSAGEVREAVNAWLQSAAPHEDGDPSVTLPQPSDLSTATPGNSLATRDTEDLTEQILAPTEEAASPLSDVVLAPETELKSDAIATPPPPPTPPVVPPPRESPHTTIPTVMPTAPRAAEVSPVGTSARSRGEIVFPPRVAPLREVGWSGVGRQWLWVVVLSVLLLGAALLALVAFVE